MVKNQTVVKTRRTAGLGRAGLGWPNELQSPTSVRPQEAGGEGGEQRAGVSPEPHQGEGRPEVRTLQLEMAKCLNINVYEILKNRKQLYSWFIICYQTIS